jgi:hypothetical protein
MATKIGFEFLVNSYTNNSQAGPSVVGLANGNFVIAWSSNGQDSAYTGVYAQLFYGNGIKLGAEFAVNSYTTNYQQNPSAAALANGNFVIAWERKVYNYNYDVYAQRFDGNGTKLGTEFRVNSYTTDYQRNPSAAALANGHFVIAWDIVGQDLDLEGVYTQLFYGDGIPLVLGGDSPVNSYFSGSQLAPSVAALENGNYIIAWQSNGQDGSSYGVYAQRFDGNGTTRLGAEFRVNSYTNSSQAAPSMAALANNSFIVAWESDGQDGSSYGVYAQRFDGNGTWLGAEFRVNSNSVGSQRKPSIVALTNNNFVIAWQSDGQGGSYDIYAQRFDDNGTRLGTEFRVNSFTVSNQTGASAAALANGNFVITWESNGQDGSSYGIYAQLFPRYEIVLVNNQLAVTEGQNLLVTVNDFCAVDVGNLANNVQFTLSDIRFGQFELTINPGVAATSFTQQQINNSQVRFIHDGGEMAPNFTINITDGYRFNDGILANVTFAASVNDPPLLINNQLMVTEKQTVVLTRDNLQALDPDNTDDQLIFSIADLQGGQFNLVTNPGYPISNFTQQQVNSSQVWFVQNGDEGVSYQVSVSDGVFSTEPAAANITFININDAPVVLQNPQDQTVLLNQAFAFTVNTSNVFHDPDGDALTFVAESDNNLPLPSWIHVNRNNNQLIFDGTSPSIIGTSRVTLWATDSAKATSAPARFQINTVTNNNTLITGGEPQDNTPTIASAVAGGVAGLALIAGGGIGLWRYLRDKVTRQKDYLADAIRSALNLKGVDNFEGERGQKYVAFVQCLSKTLIEQVGVDVANMSDRELQILASAIAQACRDKVTSSTNCLGQSIIEVSDLETRVIDIANQVQKLRYTSSDLNIEMNAY